MPDTCGQLQNFIDVLLAWLWLAGVERPKDCLAVSVYGGRCHMPFFHFIVHWSKPYVGLYILGYYLLGAPAPHTPQGLPVHC